GKPPADIATARASRIAEPALADMYGMTALAVQPSIQEPDCRCAMNGTSGNPHDQARQLLVRRGIHSNPGGPHRGIVRVPGALRQGHQCAERTLDQRRQEKACRRHQMPASPRVYHRSPEQQRRDDEAEMLRDMPAATVERAIE